MYSLNAVILAGLLMAHWNKCDSILWPSWNGLSIRSVAGSYLCRARNRGGPGNRVSQIWQCTILCCMIYACSNSGNGEIPSNLRSGKSVLFNSLDHIVWGEKFQKQRHKFRGRFRPYRNLDHSCWGSLVLREHAEEVQVVPNACGAQLKRLNVC